MTSLPVLHDELRPRTWGDCLRDGWGDAGTPCPWVSCAHHLAWTRAIRGDVGPGRPCEPGDERATAKLEAALSDGDSWLLDEMPATCALRVAQEPLSLDEIGAHFGFTRERARQIERIALRALDSYSNRPLLSDLLDGREVSRPDLAPQTSHFLTSADLRPALARLDPDHARLAEEASRRQGGTLRVEVRPRIAPPVRVLAGAERARRIAELKARGTAPPMDSPAGQPAATTTQETPTMTTTTKADLIEIAAAHGSKSLFAGARLAGLSASTAHSISKGLTPTERTLAKIAEALAKVRAGEKLAKPAKAAKPVRAAKPAKAAPSSPITLDLLPRLVRVIERLGGLDRAERLAEALR